MAWHRLLNRVVVKDLLGINSSRRMSVFLCEGSEAASPRGVSLAKVVTCPTDSIMQSLANYAAAIAIPQLKLPDNAQFSIDGQRIAQNTTSISASLTRSTPAVIIEISEASRSIPDAIDFSKTYARSLSEAMSSQKTH